jgi:hypothetical protein
VGDIEIGAVVAMGLHFVVDGSGHDVAGCQILQVVILFHEGRAVPPFKNRPLSPDRLGNEE